MNRLLAKIISVAELLIAITMYFVILYQFSNDPVIMEILPETDMEATLLRLSIYIVPGINLIAGCFGMTFDTKGVLTFVGILEILAGYMTLYFKGKSEFMHVMGIVMMVFGVLFILCVLTLRKDKKEKKKV